MAGKKRDKPETPETTEEVADVTEATVVVEEAETGEPPEGVWLRGFWMLILALLFGVAEFILAVLQFLWMLFAKEKNQFLRGTGETIGRWMHAVAVFQTGATEDKPFPWRRLD